MEIKITADDISASVGSAVSESLAKGLNGYQIRFALDAAVVDSIKDAGIVEAVKAELDRRLSEEAPEIVRACVDAALPSLRTMFRAPIETAMIAMAHGLLTGKPQFYSDSDRARWSEAQRMVCGATEDDGE